MLVNHCYGLGHHQGDVGSDQSRVCCVLKCHLLDDRTAKNGFFYNSFLFELLQLGAGAQKLVESLSDKTVF